MKYPNARRQHTRTNACRTSETSFSHTCMNYSCNL